MSQTTQPTPAPELLAPCPFCGKVPNRVRAFEFGGAPFWDVACCIVTVPRQVSAQLAADLWNQRASSTGDDPAEFHDQAMALHWIDRYAAGIDCEPQLDRIAECLAAPSTLVAELEALARRWDSESKSSDSDAVAIRRHAFQNASAELTAILAKHKDSTHAR